MKSALNQEIEARKGQAPYRLEDVFAPPFAVLRPKRQTLPLVFNSPHSGDIYPEGFLAASRLDATTLRRSEDCFVDRLFAAAPELGAVLMKARFPRAFLDVNREPYELDPAMFEEPLPAHANTASFRVNGGFGTIARVVAEGEEIYHAKLTLAEAEQRILALHLPYHQALTALLEETQATFGCALLIDCHSMPSAPERPAATADFVLGDRFGRSCAAAVTETVADFLTGQGYRVALNSPFAGGYSTRRYGRPATGCHALQIEISRALYMDEAALAPHDGFDRLKADLAGLIKSLAGTDLRPLAPAPG